MERMSGEVAWFSNRKGFGFIRRDDKEADVFVHYSEIECSGYKSLREGQRVTFGVETGRSGLQAAEVRTV